MSTAFLVTIRPGRVEDASALGRLWWHAFPQKFGAAFGDDVPRAITLLADLLQAAGGRAARANTVAEADGQVVGFLLLNPGQGAMTQFPLMEAVQALHHHLGRWGMLRAIVVSSLLEAGHPRPSRDQAVVELVGVDPAWRGRGVGRTLMEVAIARAWASGACAVTLDVAWGNEAARSLYESLGFQSTLERRSRLLQWLTGYPGWTRMTLPQF
jgi:ribosomal protein S18 acetylase RimI-like enzyme